MVRDLALTAALLVLPTALAGHQSGALWDRDVPAVLMEAASDGTVLEVAQLLVKHGVPAAAIVRREDGSDWYKSSIWRRQAQHGAGGSSDRVAARSVVEKFLALHPEYTTSTLGHSLLLFLPRRDSPCTVRLFKPGLPGSLKGRAFEVAYNAIAMANGSSVGHGPSMVYVGPRSGPQPGEPDYMEPVDIQLQSPSLGEVLAELTLQVPGLGWGVREQVSGPVEPRPEHFCRVVLFTGSTRMDMPHLFPQRNGEP